MLIKTMPPLAATNHHHVQQQQSPSTSTSTSTSTSPTPIRQCIEEMLIGAATELFEANDVDLVSVPLAIHDSKNQVIAIIGFTASGFRGALGMMIDIAVVNRIAKNLGVDGGGAPSSDIASELANQLLGTFKNKILPYGPSLSMSVPLGLRGLSIALRSNDTAISSFNFAGKCGTASIWLDARIDEAQIDFDFDRRSETPPGLEAGDFLFFD